jgi:hypothetical protein
MARDTSASGWRFFVRCEREAQNSNPHRHPSRAVLGVTIFIMVGVQSICVWANENGLVPDDVQWTDPFSKLRLSEERSSARHLRLPSSNRWASHTRQVFQGQHRWHHGAHPE